MIGDKNDTRFSLMHTTIGKWIIRIGLVAIVIMVILKILGYIE